MAGKRRSARGDKAKEAPSVDRILGELEEIVEELEGGELPLEKALERFEQGVRLSREGGRVLDEVEQRVEILLEEGDVAPFASTDDESDS